MGDSTTLTHTSARADVYAYLAQTFGESTLLAMSMAALNRAGVVGGVGWTIPLPPDLTGTERHLWFMLPAAFPDEAPIVRIDPSPFNVWPHTTLEGNLCLWVDGLDPVGKAPEEQARIALAAAADVIKLIMPPENPAAIRREFDREWVSYWRTPGNIVSPAFALLLGVPSAHPVFVSAVAATTQSAHRRVVLLAGDAHGHDAWKRALVVDARSLRHTEALYVPIAHPLRGPPPSQAALLALLHTLVDPDIVHALNLRLQNADGPFYVVFGYESEEGHSFAALELTLQLEQRPNQRGPYNAREYRDRLSRRNPNGWHVKPMSIERADLAWIHGRGFDREAQHVAGKHVWVIGCGSLGGLIIRGLAAAGVGQLTLVDGEYLEAANLGRHVLTARNLGCSKAKALAELLREQLPHLRVEGVAKDYPGVQPPSGANAPDLVISATADWPSDWRLMKALAAGGVRWLQLAWAEPHAIAGHAVIGSSKSDMQSLFDADGRFVRAATQWDAAAQPLPGCAGTHQPGTFNRLQRIAGLAVEQAIGHLLVTSKPEHLMWLGDDATLRRVGGKWRHETAIPQGIRERTLALSVPERVS